METTLKGHSSLRPSEKTREIIIDLICYLFVALFIYTAASKIMTFDSFKEVLGASPLIGSYHVTIAWMIPAIEILIGLLLIIPTMKKVGLYSSFLLMVVFTAYLIYMIFSHSTLPCQCGGVISSMSWKQHIWFNFGLIILAFIGLRLYKK